MRYSKGLWFIVALSSNSADANFSHAHQQNNSAGGSTDVVVDIPPEVRAR